ncbi:single-stranded DNA-binding protein [Acinetobacter sp. 5862]|uniref:single-stranded DNA-binding protein n=1 Tax=Acinetobacter sp. 5862 TaxID=2967169 RepID=UPI002112FE2A|nr:single-stranded DNA-binding protein [Acinetobacter sp. 5862]
MRGINKVILIGELNQNPETVVIIGQQELFTKLSIATYESWTDKKSGQRKEQTELHHVMLSNHLAEIAKQYLQQGSKIYIEGALRTRQWTDSHHQQRYITEIYANKIEFLDARPHYKNFNQQHTSTYNKSKVYHAHHYNNDYDTCDDYEYGGEKICGVCDTPISGDECYNCEIGD